MLEELKEYFQKYKAGTSIMKNQPNIFAGKIIIAKNRRAQKMV